MAAAIICASCKRPLRVPENALGRLVQCPLCLDEFVAQADPAAEVAARAVEAPIKHKAARPQPVIAPVFNNQEAEVEEFEIAPAWVEPDAEIAPPEKSADKARAVKSLVISVLVTRDPDRILRGPMEAELTYAGLYLRKPRQAPAFAAVGTGARYLGANRLVVTIEGREVELTVVKPWTSVYHLARDTAGFLNGKGSFPNGRVYDIPSYLYPLPSVFVILPFAACPFGLLTDGCGGALLWCLIASVLAGAGFAVVFQSRLLPRTRLIGAGSVVGLGALIYLFAFLFTPSKSLDASLWRTYIPPDSGFRVKLPGSPTITRNPTGAFIADPDEDTVTYTVDVNEPEVRFIVIDSAAVTAKVGLNQLLGGNINDKASNDAKKRLQQQFPLAQQGEAFATAVTPINGLPYYYISYQTMPNLGGGFTTTNRTLEARIVPAPGRTYTLVIVGPEVRTHSPDALKFFDSFQINQPAIDGRWPRGR